MSYHNPSSIATEFPKEIWTTILNFAFDPRQEYFYSSRKAIINVLAELSHDYSKLTKRLDISMYTRQPAEENDQIANYCCANDYGSLLEHALRSGALPSHQNNMAAARSGSLDCLKVLEVYGGHTGSTLSEDILNEAALFGQVNIVEYLLGKGVAPSLTTLGFAIQSGNIELVKKIQSPDLSIEKLSSFALNAAKSGNLEMVKFVEQYIPLSPWSINGAGLKGSIDILKYYMDKGFTLSEIGCVSAAEHQKWEYLKFALHHGAPMSAQLMAALAKVNAVELMRELRAKECPWEVTAVKRATKEGHLEALKYLIENGCPLTEALPLDSHADATVIAAGMNGVQYQVLQLRHVTTLPC